MPSKKKIGANSKENRAQKQPQSKSSSTDETYPAKPIIELLATSKRSPQQSEADDITKLSPNKRLKYDQSPNENVTPAAVRTMRAEDRFNFSSPIQRRTSGVIDLTTDSQNGSPRKKKAVGLGTTNITSQAAPRKLIISNRKQTPRTDPDEYYNRFWKQMDAALTAIFFGDRLPYSMEELYKGVEIACRQNRAPLLYKKLCSRCSAHVSDHVKGSLLRSAESNSDIEALSAVVRAWSIWNKQLETIRSIFFYLDRSYLLHSPLLPSLEEMGTDEFRNHIFLNMQLKPKVLQGACDLVGADRDGSQDVSGEPLFRDAIKMFHALTVYTKFFEPKLMGESEQYFLSWTKHEISSKDLAGYVDSCGIVIRQELGRCDKYGLDQTTKKGLETYLEDILIDQRQARLLVVEDVGMIMGQDRLEILSQLFSLLQRRRLGEKLRPAFEAFINKQGSGIVFDEEREQEMVTRLLDFKRKLNGIWEGPFQRHEGLGHSLREAFENFINQSKRSNMTWGTDNPKPGEMIAKYVDMVLKGGTKAIRASGAGPVNEDAEGSSDDEDVEIGKQLDQVLDLFRFVHGKAVFEAFYKRDLARRLLLGRSASADSEKSMLTRLKSGTLLECTSMR